MKHHSENKLRINSVIALSPSPSFKHASSFICISSPFLFLSVPVSLSSPTLPKFFYALWSLINYFLSSRILILMDYNLCHYRQYLFTLNSIGYSSPETSTFNTLFFSSCSFLMPIQKAEISRPPPRILMSSQHSKHFSIAKTFGTKGHTRSILAPMTAFFFSPFLRFRFVKHTI